MQVRVVVLMMWYGGALGILSMRWMNEVVENLSFQCRVSVAVYQVLSSFYILIPTYFVPVKSWGRPLLKSWGRPLFVLVDCISIFDFILFYHCCDL